MIPECSKTKVREIIRTEGIRLTFKPKIKSNLGVFKHPSDRDFGVPEIIIYENSPHCELFTFVHELAHYYCWKRNDGYHGHDYLWKMYYRQLMTDFYQFFPDEIIPKLKIYMDNSLKASSDLAIQNLLKRYDFPDQYSSDLKPVKTIEFGEKFLYENSEYVMIGLSRKFYDCKKVSTNATWKFNGETLVKPL